MAQSDPFALDDPQAESQSPPAQPKESQLEISAFARKKLAEILSAQAEGSFLRICVRGGGCSGYQVSFKVDRELRKSDILKEEGKARVVIDAIALSIVGHAILEYQDNFSGSFFHLVVPGSVSQCGCGESFAL